MAYHYAPVEETRMAAPVRMLALMAVPTALVAVFAMRAQHIAPAAGFAGVTLACILAASSIALSVVGMMDIWQTGKRGLGRLIRFAVLAGMVLAMPGYFAVQAFRLPAIVDVMTDLETPPLFSEAGAIAGARGGPTHPLPDKRAMAAQARAYPAVRPLLLDMPADEAYELVQAALLTLKWGKGAYSPPILPDRRGEHGRQGLIEAVVESTILRLRHDVVIRIMPQGQQTRIDIRAASRFGRHDLGANAAYILRLVEEIKAQEE